MRQHRRKSTGSGVATSPPKAAVISGQTDATSAPNAEADAMHDAAAEAAKEASSDIPPLYDRPDRSQAIGKTFIFLQEVVVVQRADVMCITVLSKYPYYGYQLEARQLFRKECNAQQ